MQRRFLVVGFVVGLGSSFAASCGGGAAMTKSCSPASCGSGCCSANGDCLQGTGLFACGSGGEACQACLPNQVCNAGACENFADGDYDASFPDYLDPSIRYDAGTYHPPDAGMTFDAGVGDAGPANVSYSAQVQPIFDSRCDACHAWSYDTIVNVNARITPGNLGASAIYTRTLSGDMPRSGGPLTGTQVNLIRDWILNGAPRN
ncbi:MAG: hypothetical protein U0228_29275 [Myxococcaceae bacterium]